MLAWRQRVHLADQMGSGAVSPVWTMALRVEMGMVNRTER